MTIRDGIFFHDGTPLDGAAVKYNIDTCRYSPLTGPAFIGLSTDFDGVSAWEKHAVPVQLPWAAPWEDLSDVLVTRDGRVWVANDTLNGLAEFGGETWTLHGAGVGRFTELKEDLDGNVWMRSGTGGGLFFWKFDHSAFTQMPFVTTPTSIGIGNDGAVYLGDWFGNIRKSVDGFICTIRTCKRR